MKKLFAPSGQLPQDARAAFAALDRRVHEIQATLGVVTARILEAERRGELPSAETEPKPRDARALTLLNGEFAGTLPEVPRGVRLARDLEEQTALRRALELAAPRLAKLRRDAAEEVLLDRIEERSAAMRDRALAIIALRRAIRAAVAFEEDFAREAGISNYGFTATSFLRIDAQGEGLNDKFLASCLEAEIISDKEFQS